jgi:hypothetical protein
MVTISLHNLDDMDRILQGFELSKSDLEQIVKYKRKISKKLEQDWKYGSSWIDVWLLNLDIKRFNTILKQYSIELERN